MSIESVIYLQLYDLQKRKTSRPTAHAHDDLVTSYCLTKTYDQAGFIFSFMQLLNILQQPAYTPSFFRSFIAVCACHGSTGT